MHIFVCKLRLHFPDSKHLRCFIGHEIFGNFFRHSEIFRLHPQLYMLATALPPRRQHELSKCCCILCLRYTCNIFLFKLRFRNCYNYFPLSPLCPANSNVPPFGCSDLLSTNRFSSDFGCLETFSSSLYIYSRS